MKNKRIVKALTVLLSISLSMGTAPVTWATEFSSGEEMEMFFSDGGMDQEEKTEEELQQEITSEVEIESGDTDIFTDTEAEWQDDAADTGNTSEITDTEFVFINPLYEDVITIDDLVESEELPETEDLSEFWVSEEGDVSLFSANGIQTQMETIPVCDSIEEAAELLKDCMIDREMTLQYIYDCSEGESLGKEEIFEKFDYAVEHTGDPVEGDYLKYQYGGFKVSLRGAAEAYLVTWTLTYYTTAEQEQEMDRAVASLLNDMRLTGKTDYEKTAAIYDYICSTVKYDYANLYDDDYKLKYSGYAALVNKTAVCQGYAVLLYRLLLENDIDCRIVAGTSYNQNHSWNLIKLGNQYYDADSTWDAGNLTYEYFLKCEGNFLNHDRDEEYLTESFVSAYPVDSKDYVVKESDVSSGILYMENDIVYQLVNGTAIVLEYQGNAKEITIPESVNGYSVTSISDYAFYDCDQLQMIHFTGNAPAIGAQAFYQADVAAVYPYGNETWTENVQRQYGGTVEWIAHGENYHNWKLNEESSVKVTCENDGENVWNCRVCHVEDKEPVSATGHDWSVWKTTNAASYAANGLKERTCGNCGGKETKTIAKKVLQTPVIKSVSDAPGKTIVITWEPVKAAAGYYIYCKTAESGWALLAKTSAAENSYTDSTPKAGVTYTYTVRAFVQENGKTYSSKYEAGLSAVAKPAAPTVKVKELAYNKVEVTWNKVDGAEGYRVYRKKSGSSSWTSLKTITSSTTSYTDMSVQTGTTYYYTVRPYCKASGTTLWGEYISSEAVTATTAAPTLVSAKSSSYNKIKVTWETVAGASGYRIYRKKAGASSWSSLKTVSSSVTSYTDSTAQTGTTYYYTVKSYCTVNGKTVWGKYDTTGLSAVAKTAAPKLVSATILSSGKTKITWEKVAGASGYRIYKKNSSGGWTALQTVDSSTVSYTYAKSNGKSAVYTVRAYRTVNGKNVWGFYKEAGICSK